MRAWLHGAALLAAALAASFVIAIPAQAQLRAQEPEALASETDNARYQALIEELRCLVCQNQNIAESNAELAVDLRRQVRDMIADGQTDAQIKTYLQARYGDFVLYRPPMTGRTLLLWIGPFLFLALVLIVLAWRTKRSRSQPEPAAMTGVDRKRLDALLTKTEPAADTTSPESKP